MIEIITRSQWRARQPTKALRPWQTTPQFIVWHHTYSPGCGLYTPEQEARFQRMMQDAHIARGWGDIGQHFTVFASGRIYEARDLRYVGVHAAGANSYTIGIEHQGNFHGGCKPTDLQVHASAKLIAWLARKYNWTAASLSQRVRPHRYFSATACPGADGVAAIPTVVALAARYMDTTPEEETMRIRFKIGEDETFCQHIYTGRPVWLHWWVERDLPSDRRLHVAISKWGKRQYSPENVVWAHWVQVGYAGTLRLDDKVPPGEYLLAVWLPGTTSQAVTVYGDVEL